MTDITRFLNINKSVDIPLGREFQLPRNEHTPVYRLQSGPIFSVQFAGDAHSSYRDTGGQRSSLCFLF